MVNNIANQDKASEAVLHVALQVAAETEVFQQLHPLWPSQAASTAQCKPVFHTAYHSATKRVLSVQEAMGDGGTRAPMPLLHHAGGRRQG